MISDWGTALDSIITPQFNLGHLARVARRLALSNAVGTGFEIQTSDYYSCLHNPKVKNHATQNNADFRVLQ